MTPYERRKAAQARMNAYWAKKRADAEQARADQVVRETAVAVEPMVVAEASVAVIEKPVEVVVPVVEAPVVVEVKVPMARTHSTEYRIIANTDGQMVCESGPCLCGKGKREWHQICCKA
jgi:hypothetical protein